MEVYCHIEKNKFGYNTWHIKFSALFHLFINETGKGSYVIDFKEWKWICYKTHFSFLSSDRLDLAIIEAFERMFNFYKLSKDYIWTEEDKNSQLAEALDIISKIQLRG